MKDDKVTVAWQTLLRKSHHGRRIGEKHRSVSLAVESIHALSISQANDVSESSCSLLRHADTSSRILCHSYCARFPCEWMQLVWIALGSNSCCRCSDFYSERDTCRIVSFFGKKAKILSVFKGGPTLAGVGASECQRKRAPTRQIKIQRSHHNLGFSQNQMGRSTWLSRNMRSIERRAGGKELRVDRSTQTGGESGRYLEKEQNEGPLDRNAPPPFLP